MTTPYTPLVSVVIPTYQRPDLLMTRSLPSALGQWYERLEVVVVVDGPDAVTEQALTDLAARDLRVRPVFLPRNMGGSDARNAGVQAARGEWIAFLDDDDEWLPHNLEQHLEAVAQRVNGERRWLVSVCGSLTRTPDGDLANPQRLPDAHEPLGDYILARRTFRERECSFMTSAIFCSRELLLAHPFRSGLPRHQDWDWVLRIAATSEVSFRFSQEIATIWYHGEARRQISNSLNWSQSLAWIQICRQQHLVTDKAMVGFLNRSVADYARRSGDYHALPILVKMMVAAHARPFEWLYFIAIWTTPTFLRAWIRRFRAQRVWLRRGNKNIGIVMHQQDTVPKRVAAQHQAGLSPVDLHPEHGKGAD
ncbi:glycosyltransferase family 2 protein [Deinococcus sp.]|uniref:glycosyltransferase family 2 protein n=1 Tax=Deinococcus sp. TaxID=47478 RepID=UPI003C7EC25F